MALGDENVAAGLHRHGRGRIEDVVARARLAGFAELQQDLAVGTELDRLHALAVLRLEVDAPDIAILVDGDAVAVDERPCAEILQRLSARRQLDNRAEARTGATLITAAVQHPDIVFGVHRDRIGRAERPWELRSIRGELV